MKKEHLFFIITICAALLGGFLLIYPFLQYLLFALLLTYLLHPLKRWLQKKVRNRSLAAFILILGIITLVILPTIYITTQLVQEVRTALSLASESSGRLESLARIQARLEHLTGRAVDLHAYQSQLAVQLKDYLVSAAPNFLGSVSDIVVGWFIMLFVMFYLFQEGRSHFERVRVLIPLAPSLKDKLIEEVRNVTWAVVYGQVMTAIVQGTMGGIGFLIFGLSNPVFWGFVMVILSFLPLVGTALVWVPAGIFLMVSGETFRGIGLLVFNAVIVANVDNFLKPRLISGKSNIHPVTVLLGVLGGLKLFGFIGLFAGPLILALLASLVQFYEEEYLGEGARSEAKS